MRYQLRDYQLEAVEKARAALREGRKRPLVVAPTGSGKTVIACEIVEAAVRKGSRTLFLAHRLELIEQTSRKLDEIGVDHGVIKAGHPRVRPDLPVQVASVQTVRRRLRKEGTASEAGGYKLIIVDEAHHSAAESYRAILEDNPDAVVLGLTATPYRADGAPLGKVFDALVEVTTLGDLIEAGHLVMPRVFGRAPPDLSGVKLVGRDYNLGQLGEVMDRAPLVDHLVKGWLEKAAGRTTVAFAVSIQHSRNIAAAFAGAGVRAGHVDGNMPEPERARVLAALARGELQVVSNCAILTEGWDLPACSCVILARPTQSRSLWKQMCGRALRPAPGKTDCLILDHAGCWKVHGFLEDADEVSLSVREPRTSPARENHCPHCGVVFPGWPRFCPECGVALPRTSLVAEEPPAYGTADELREISQLEAQIAFYREVATRARERNYKAGYVALKFKERFNMYPAERHMGKDPRLHTSLAKDTDGKWRGIWVVDDPAE